MFSKLQTWWANFEAWVHSWFPGFKTRITTALGAISSLATVSYGYIQGLPTTKWLSQEALAGTSFVLFTLSYWFSNMGQRVKDAE